jgi:hypothetical protein
VAGEGPSAGLCTVKCATDPQACARADKSSVCVVLNDNGTTDLADDIAFCLPKCTLGTPSANVEKCRSRVDLVCEQTSAGSTAGQCRPACRADIDCGARVCDLRTGLCADAPPPGGAIGDSCVPNQTACAGGCFSHSATYAECSGLCSLGTAGCGQSHPDAPLSFYCYYDSSNKGGNGDLGNCAKLCDCDAQCGRPDAVCEPVPSLTASTGRKGVCGSKMFASGGARPNIAACTP